jgi:hypothetical protein
MDRQGWKPFSPIAAFIVSALLCLQGCRKKIPAADPSGDLLVGEWRSAQNQEEGVDLNADGTVEYVFPPHGIGAWEPETENYYQNSSTTYTRGEGTIIFRTDVRRTLEYKRRTKNYVAQDGFKVESSTYKLDGDALNLGGKVLYRRR